MVRVLFDEKYIKVFSKITSIDLKERIIKQVERIELNPQIGKPMRYDRKGTREVYIKPYRLAYYFDSTKKKVYITDFYHKDKQ